MKNARVSSRTFQALNWSSDSARADDGSRNFPTESTFSTIRYGVIVSQNLYAGTSHTIPHHDQIHRLRFSRVSRNTNALERWWDDRVPSSLCGKQCRVRMFSKEIRDFWLSSRRRPHYGRNFEFEQSSATVKTRPLLSLVRPLHYPSKSSESFPVEQRGAAGGWGELVGSCYACLDPRA